MNQYEPEDYTKSWVSYLDLLGITDLVHKKDWVDVSYYYEKAVKEFTEVYNLTSKVERAWLSDTFILYSPDNTACSFVEIESITHAFILSLIEHSIPVRGAMSCGDFYADKKKNILFGPALIDAYCYGENQDWIGFVLTPSAVEQITVIGYHIDQTNINYAYWDIPYKKIAYCASAPKDTPCLKKSLPAYIIGNSQRSGVDRHNECLNRLYKMKGKQKDCKLIRKYENTINFIEKKQMNLG